MSEEKQEAREPLVELRSLWMERAKRLRRDPAYTDCAATLESCADELSSVFGQPQEKAQPEPFTVNATTRISPMRECGLEIRCTEPHGHTGAHSWSKAMAEKAAQLLSEAVREAAMNFEKLNEEPPVRSYFCSLCTAPRNADMPTWEQVEHTPECLVSRSRSLAGSSVLGAATTTSTQPHPNEVAQEIVDTWCSLYPREIANTHRIDLHKRIADAIFKRDLQASPVAPPREEVRALVAKWRSGAKFVMGDADSEWRGGCSWQLKVCADELEAAIPTQPQCYWNYDALPCAKCGGIHDGGCAATPLCGRHGEPNCAECNSREAALASTEDIFLVTKPPSPSAKVLPSEWHPRWDVNMLIYYLRELQKETGAALNSDDAAVVNEIEARWQAPSKATPKPPQDVNLPVELAKQRVRSVEQVMKLGYIKATRNTSEGEIRFVARDDVITAIRASAEQAYEGTLAACPDCAATPTQPPEKVPLPGQSAEYDDAERILYEVAHLKYDHNKIVALMNWKLAATPTLRAQP